MKISWKILALAALTFSGCGDAGPPGSTNAAASSGAAGAASGTPTSTSTTGGAGGSDSTASTTGGGGVLNDGGDTSDGSRGAGGTAIDGSLLDQAVGRDGGPALTRMVLFAGGGMGGDGVQATQSRVAQPFAVARDPLTGDYYIAEYQGNRVRRVDPAGIITTVVGQGAAGEAGRTTLNEPHHLIFPPAGGDLFIGDTFNSRILRLDVKMGAIAPFAANAGFGKTFCLAFDPRGERLYVADTDNHRVRAVDLKTSMVTNVAGNGSTGKPMDGAMALQAPLVDPRAIAIDSKGILYILERNGNALRMVDAQGKIFTIAGTGQVGNSGDGGDPLAATMNGPKHVATDLEDNVLISDTENHVIRKIFVTQKKIVRLAGTGTQGFAGVPGAPTSVQLARPHGAFVAPDGTIFISDSFNNRVLKLE
ncbi:MAG TPA: hypothetical protein VF881_17345 [Polyangiaceae bacterium]